MKEKASANATIVLENGVDTIQTLETAFAEAFPFKSLSEAQAAFETAIQNDPNCAIMAPNSTLQKAIPVTRDASSTMVGHIHALKTFITLSLPIMEDGNNFGVSIQLEVLKAMTEASKEINNVMEEFPKYYSARADALDKLNLLKSTTTSTKTSRSSEGTNKGVKEVEDGPTSSKNESNEEKTITTGVSNVLADKTLTHRIQHVVSLDLQLYAKLQLAMQQSILSYASLLDNVEKNYLKLSMPKGSGDRHGHRMMF